MAENDKKLILVIDDDRDMLEAIKIMLETAGFAVGLAVDSTQGSHVQSSPRDRIPQCTR